MKTKMKIAVILIALIVAISIGGAALVNHLSNTLDQDVVVSSPLAVHDVTIPDMYAGENQTVDISVEDLANVDVCGQVEITVNDGNFDCIGITMDTGEEEVCEWVESGYCSGRGQHSTTCGNYETEEACDDAPNRKHCGWTDTSGEVCTSGLIPCSGGIFAFPCVTYTAGTTDTTALRIDTEPALDPTTYGFSTVVRPCEC